MARTYNSHQECCVELLKRLETAKDLLRKQSAFTGQNLTREEIKSFGTVFAEIDAFIDSED